MQTRLNGRLIAVLGISLSWALMAFGCSYTVGGDGPGGGTGGDAGPGGGSSPFASSSGSSSQDSPYSTSSGGSSNGASVFGSSSSGGSDSPFGGSGGGSVGSGVDGDKEIGELSGEEKSNVCLAASEYTLSLLSKDELCRFSAFLQLAFSDNPQERTDEELQQACTDAKEMCEGQTINAESFGGCGSVPGGDSCTVTVSKWEACEQALSDKFAQAVKQLPACSEVTSDDFTSSSMNGGGDQTPAECTELKEKCPEFYNSNVGPLTSTTEPDPVQDVGVTPDSGTGDTGVAGDTSDTSDTGAQIFDIGSDL